MLRNYLKIALRNLKRQPGYALINVSSLAIGMACCILIALYIRAETEYDRFIPDADRVYRVALDLQMQDLILQSAYSPWPLSPTLKSDFPEVEASTRLWNDPSGRMVIRYEDKVFAEEQVFFADSSFFEVMDFPLIHGDVRTVLRDPFSIVLTASAAARYFGDENPVGRVLHLREPSDRDVFDYQVTGVMPDVPAQSHMAFDFLGSYVTQRQSRSQSWLGFGVYTYVKLRDGTRPTDFEAKLPGLFRTYGSPQIQESYGTSLEEFERAGNHYAYFLQPVTDIHLRSNLDDEIEPNGDIRLIYLFATIALFVLVLAGINFVNLATARAVKRGREVGVRKTLGSHRLQLIVQFLTESMMLSLTGMTIAVLLVKAAIPYFNLLAGNDLRLGLAEAAWMAPSLIGLLILVGLGAGAYPSFYLSGFRPALVLKGEGGVSRKSRLRDTLVIFQFAIATTLIACTAVVYNQIHFMLTKDLGFEPEEVIVLEGAEVMGNSERETFRQTLRGLPGVVRVTNSEQVPGRRMNGSTFKVAGATDDASAIMEYTYASYDFIETLGLELAAGRSLSRDHPTDSLAVLLNETAVRQLGLEDPIGQRLDWIGESVYTVVGVVKDFHIASLHREIGPLALVGPDPRNTNRPNLLVSARIRRENWTSTLAAIKDQWNQFAPQSPFVYSFLDDTFAKFYEADRQTERLIGLFALLAVMIACFGLLGLAAFMTEQRTKEIGIRKVFGASEVGIVTMLSRHFMGLTAIAIVVSVPMAYLVMNRWLETFAYAVHIGPGVFFWAGGLSLFIALLTVSYLSLRAARTNPIQALRYE